MTKLANGHLVVVFNDSESPRHAAEHRPLDRRGPHVGNAAAPRIEPGRILVPLRDPDARRQDSRAYTFRRYTIKHVEFNEDWLVHMDRPN